MYQHDKAKIPIQVVVALMLSGLFLVACLSGCRASKTFILDGVGSINPPQGWTFSPMVKNQKDFNSQFKKDGISLIGPGGKRFDLGISHQTGIDTLFFGARRVIKKDLMVNAHVIHAAVLGYEDSDHPSGSLGYMFLFYEPLSDGSLFTFFYGIDNSLRQVVTDDEQMEDAFNRITQAVGFSLAEKE